MSIWISSSVIAMSTFFAVGQSIPEHNGISSVAMSESLPLSQPVAESVVDKDLDANTKFEHLSGGGFDLVAAVFVSPKFPEPCAADINGDGLIDTLDVVEFMNAWAGGSDLAEFTGDDHLDSRDFIEFIGLWTTGCP